jgi:hypothetical protein
LGSTASEALVNLRSLLQGDEAFVLAHPSPPNALSFEIIYQGVSLQLAVNAQVADLTGMKKLFYNPDPSNVCSSIDVSLGRNASGGERVPSILQVLLSAAAKLGLSLGAVATIWQPAKIVSGFGYFSEAVADYLDGGAFPALAMIDFTSAADGTLHTNGLRFLTGEEIQIANDNMDQGELMRTIIRAAHDLITSGSAVQAGN